MNTQLKHWFTILASAVAGCLWLAVALPLSAQDVQASADAKFDVLTRGPVHEAFLEQVNFDPQPGSIIPLQPPEPIDEIPPAYKPAGENVQWIPGYWAWEQDAEDFIWISGVWRVPPPGHRYVPGYWQKADGGHRWVTGFWVKSDARQVEYRQPPPKTLERGSTSNAPSENHFWNSGSWVYDNGKYKWRPGYWVPCQTNWIWIPARYASTPNGAVYLDGYWDHSVANRGQLFAPIRLSTAAGTRAGLRYSPANVIDTSQLFFHLFVRADQHQYLFGDYYGQTHADAGIRPWFAEQTGQGGSDPLFGYYNWYYGRKGINYLDRMTGWHRYFVGNAAMRPPRTLADQLLFVDTHAGNAHLAQSVLSSSLDSVVAAAGTSAFVQLTNDQRLALADSALHLRSLVSQRLKLESLASAAVNAEGAVNQSLQLPTQVLKLPALPDASLPGAGGLQVPANPQELINVQPVLPTPQIDPPVRLPVEVPGLPF
jgi:hypothetical protein